MVPLVGGGVPAGRALGEASSGAAEAVDPSRLEERDVGLTVRGVVGGCVEQPRQKQRAHHALVRAERVLEPQERRVVRAAGLASAVGDVNVVDRLVEAAVAQRVLEAAPQALAGVEPPHRVPARGQRGGQLVQPVDPRDLLDQVRLALDVGVAPAAAPSQLDPGAGRRSRAARGSRPPSRAMLLAEEPLDPLGAERHDAGLPGRG